MSGCDPWSRDSWKERGQVADCPKLLVQLIWQGRKTWHFVQTFAGTVNMFNVSMQHLSFLSSLLSQNQFSKCTKQQHKWCTVHIISTISGNSVLCVFPMVIVFVEMEAGSPLGDGGAGNRRPWCCIYAEELLQEKERAVWCRRGPRSVASTRSLVSFMASWLTSIFFMSTSCYQTSTLELEYGDMLNL